MEPIKIDITLLAPVTKAWEYYNGPEHIVQWNYAHETWHCPVAENDLRVDGTFKTRMEARDGSFGFDFQGTYDEIIPNKKIKYHLEDGRQVEILFHEIDATTTNVEITFDPEKQNPVEMQREGWYAILNNFHKYVENH
ncbi:SRPBCC family protein [Chryseobacterium hagamense]|uniref:Activator of HSP90 ATPase n=1 Tax=Chryseobacterium hagamense TaxID=395935 RepID=A0A511YRP8_9FLAO|nr:SRPBCC family protein [Chryseobacterium hagamense]GEN77861.1 activator of HSP90 ATPase [Chryseobacterium hagamense]